jgi:AcrR family transcriptional regulator
MADEAGAGSPGQDMRGRGRTPIEARIILVERLRARRAEIDEAIFARISDQWFDRTGSEDPEYVAGLRAAGVAALDYILAGIERSGQSLQPVPAAVLEQARRAARVGVGVETVLRRYLAGYALLEGFVIQEAERVEQDWIAPDRIPSAQGSVLRDVLQIAPTLVDRLATAVSSAYGKEIEQGGDTALESDDSQPPVRRNAGSSRAGSGTRDEPGASQVVLKGSQRERTSRRDRVLAAIVQVVAERGYAAASVGLVVERAGVSRRTFYELFPGGLDDGLVAVMEMALGRIVVLVSPRLEEDAWRDGVRSALGALLAFFDSEPALARVCIVETLGAGPVVVKHREGVVRAFRALIMARIEREIAQVSPLTAESVMASVMGIIYARLLAHDEEPLIELLGPLMGTVVAPFAVGEQAIAEEERRGNELARKIRDGAPGWSQPAQPTERDAGRDVGAALPAILTNPITRRLRECLLFLAEQGARGLSPSNREIATAIGVSHKSQISKLLSQLQDEGLAVKRLQGPGGPNAWRLTPRGEEIARALAEQEG